MTKRPILFNGDMVRAILDGRKTQTRRVVKEIPALGQPDEWCKRAGTSEFESIVGSASRYCPYGVPGDRLWVRETWQETRPFTGNIEHDIQSTHAMYYADDNVRYRDKDKWRPSIHMPRKYSRITLEVTGVRVERVQDISEADAKAEGVRDPICDCGDCIDCTYIGMFQDVWREIHGYDAWDKNPWVWVIEFKEPKP